MKRTGRNSDLTTAIIAAAMALLMIFSMVAAPFSYAEDNGTEPPKVKYKIRYMDGDTLLHEFNWEEGNATPKYTYSKAGYHLVRWEPAVADKVTADATYTAVFVVDRNGNKIDDATEEKVSVTYKDGDKVLRLYEGLVVGEDTPVLNYSKEGYTFKGWSPAFSEKVKGNTVYSAVFEKDKDKEEDEGKKTEEKESEKKTEKKRTREDIEKNIPALISPETPAKAEEVQALIGSMGSDSDLKGSSSLGLLFMSHKQKKGKIYLKWKRVPGASSYTVYGDLCRNGKGYRKIKSAKGKSLTVTKIAGKKIKGGKPYKFLVVAESGGKVVALSKTIHVMPKGSGKYANFKKVSVKASVLRKAKKLRVGKSLSLKAKEVIPNGKTIIIHKKLTYESSDEGVATVSAKGKIKAVGKGSAKIYAISQTGIYKAVKVVVK